MAAGMPSWAPRAPVSSTPPPISSPLARAASSGSLYTWLLCTLQAASPQPGPFPSVPLLPHLQVVDICERSFQSCVPR